MASPTKRKTLSDLSTRTPLIRLGVFETVFQLQRQNGLLFEDNFNMYRKYLTRKIHRLRVLNSFTQSKGRDFTTQIVVEPDDIRSSSDILLIPLLKAEQCWATAMVYNQHLEVAKVGRRKVSSHLRRRLRKATLWAAYFERLCLQESFIVYNEAESQEKSSFGNTSISVTSSRVGAAENFEGPRFLTPSKTGGTTLTDEQTCLEAHAYISWMLARLEMQREEWRSAHNHLKTAHRICVEMSKMGSIVQQDLFTRNTEDIEQSLRYCDHHMASNVGKKVRACPSSSIGNNSVYQNRLKSIAKEYDNAVLQSKLDSIAMAHSSTSDTIVKKGSSDWTEIEQQNLVKWREISIPITDADVREALLRAQSSDRKLLEGIKTIHQNIRRPAINHTFRRKVDDEGKFSELKSERNKSDIEDRYSNAIEAYDDAVCTVTKSLSSLEVIRSGGSIVESKHKELVTLKGYSGFMKAMRQYGLSKMLATRLGEKWKIQLLVGASSIRGPIKKRDVGSNDNFLRVKAEDIAHIYDTLLQIIEATATAVATVAVDDDLTDELLAKAAAVRAHRCYYLAETYANLLNQEEYVNNEDCSFEAPERSTEGAYVKDNKKSRKKKRKKKDGRPPDAIEVGMAAQKVVTNKKRKQNYISQTLSPAITLYAKANELLAHAMDLLDACSESDEETGLAAERSGLEALSLDLAGAKSRTEARVFLHSLSFSTNTIRASNGLHLHDMWPGRNSLRPLLHRLGDHDASVIHQSSTRYNTENGGGSHFSGRIVKVLCMPAIFQTLPCKPIMFDLAHNYLTVPRFDVQVCRCILLYQIPFVKISYVRFIDSFLTQVAFKRSRESRANGILGWFRRA